MYHVARTLTTCTSKGVLIILAVSFAIFFALGCWLTMWIFYVPLGLMCLRLVFTFKRVVQSAMATSWPETLEELQKQIQQVQKELAAGDAASKARIVVLKAKIRGEEPKSHLTLVPQPVGEDTDKKEEPTQLRSVSNGDCNINSDD